MLRSFFVLTAIGVVLCHMAYAQAPAPSSPKAVEAEQMHDAAARQAREAYRRAVIAADQQYVSDLDAVLKNAMQTLDIDLARTLDDQKKSAIAVLERDQAELDVTGGWTVTVARTGVVTKGLIGYWPLHGNTINWATGVVQDLSGQGNNGQLVNMSAATSPVPSTISQGLPLNGIAYVDIPMTVSSMNLSVSIWFKANTLANCARLVANSHTDADNKGFQLVLCGGGGSGIFDIGNGTKNVQAPWTLPISAGTWYHYVGVYNGSTILAYLNGAQVAAASAVSGSIAASGLDVDIGRNPAYSNVDFFNGTINDVRIYNRALSAEEVKQLFSTGH